MGEESSKSQAKTNGKDQPHQQPPDSHDNAQTASAPSRNVLLEKWNSLAGWKKDLLIAGSWILLILFIIPPIGTLIGIVLLIIYWEKVKPKLKFYWAKNAQIRVSWVQKWNGLSKKRRFAAITGFVFLFAIVFFPALFVHPLLYLLAIVLVPMNVYLIMNWSVMSFGRKLFWLGGQVAVVATISFLFIVISIGGFLWEAKDAAKHFDSTLTTVDRITKAVPAENQIASSKATARVDWEKIAGYGDQTGKYPFDTDFFSTTEVIRILKEILGKNKYQKLTERFGGVQIPIKSKSGLIYLWGCKEHFCGSDYACILIDTNEKDIFVGLAVGGNYEAISYSGNSMPEEMTNECPEELP